jgi:hypothetical protein
VGLIEWESIVSACSDSYLFYRVLISDYATVSLTPLKTIVAVTHIAVSVVTRL